MRLLEQPPTTEDTLGLSVPKFCLVDVAFFFFFFFERLELHCSRLHQNEISLPASDPQLQRPLINGSLCLSLSLLNPTETFKVTS